MCIRHINSQRVFNQELGKLKPKPTMSSRNGVVNLVFLGINEATFCHLHTDHQTAVISHWNSNLKLPALQLVTLLLFKCLNTCIISFQDSDYFLCIAIGKTTWWNQTRYFEDEPKPSRVTTKYSFYMHQSVQIHPGHQDAGIWKASEI